MSSGEGTSTSTPKAAIPKEVIAKLAEFNKALGEVEQALSKHFAVPFEQHVSEVCCCRCPFLNIKFREMLLK